MMRRISTSLALVCLLLAAGAAGAAEYRFERIIGKPPQIGEPINLAVDRAGTIYVADRTNSQIVRITAEGQMTITRNGVKRPTALSANGTRLVIADESDGGSIAVHGINGSKEKAKTFRVAATGAAARMGGPPAGVAADAQGNLYVTDQFANVVKKYSASGELLQTWGKKGEEPGAFQGPRGIAVDREGNVYVADEYNHRIQKFSSNGQFLGTSSVKTLGVTISDGLGPMSVAVDSKGGIWVAAHTNFHVYKLTPDFRMEVRLDTFGRRPGELAGPVSVAVDANDDVYILDRSRRIQRFSPQGEFLWKFEFPPAAPGELSAPTGLRTDAAGNLWVSDTANFRIQKFAPDGTPLAVFGGFGHGPGEFNGVESLTFDSDGNLWAVDSYNHRVQKFTPEGSHMLTVGTFGEQDGEFIRTKVIDSDPTYPDDPSWEVSAESSGTQSSPAKPSTKTIDTILVNDWHNGRVQRFDTKGRFIHNFGDTGPASRQVHGPTGLAVDRQGNVYVSSWFNNTIQKFDNRGRWLMSIGSKGSGDGQLNGPARLTMDRDGNLVVADWGNNRVQTFSTDGRFLSKVGSQGREGGQFDQPVGVAVDNQGNLFVSDAANSRVQMFRPVREKGDPREPRSGPVSQVQPGHPVYTHVAVFDVKAGEGERFEATVRELRALLKKEPSFINERVLRNVDGLTLQYATYIKFTDPAAAERTYTTRLERLRRYCRREPEAHLTKQTDAYSLSGITTTPNGREYGEGLTGQIAHLGFFIPIPQYRKQYEDVLHETKVLTLQRKPEGYIGEDLLVEVAAPPPQTQTPYSPRATEASPMSINYGEYKTMENAEDSYITRQAVRDQKLVTMERVFFSSLQVPTRFYIFQVIDNYGSPAPATRIAAGGR